MTRERREEIRNCCLLLFSERGTKQKREIEMTGIALLFQYYLSLLYDNLSGGDFSFQVLAKKLEKNRLSLDFYLQWNENFSHFLYVVTGRQSACSLFDFMKPICGGAEKTKVGSFMRKTVRSLWNLQLTKEEADDFLNEIIPIVYTKLAGKYGCPYILADSLAELFCRDLADKSDEAVIFGAGFGQAAVLMKQRLPKLSLSLDEEEEEKEQISRLICFCLAPEQNWTKNISENERRIHFGVSFWPFGKTKEKTEKEYFPKTCIPSLKGEYKLLGKWLFQLSDKGVFYFLCPAGFLYREGREKKLRQFLIEKKNLLDGIFLLPDKLWNGGFPETVLLRFSGERAEEDSVFMLDGSAESTESIKKLVSIFGNREVKKGLSVKIERKQIKEQEMNLNPVRYLNKKQENKSPVSTIVKSKRRLLEIERDLEDIENKRKIYEMELNL